MDKFNSKLEEIKEYLKNECFFYYSKRELIIDGIASKLDYLEGHILDELGIEDINIDLETYTSDVFDRVIHLVCNVLDSYKEEVQAEPNTFWTPAYQSYFSAGDDAEEFCINCETYVEDDFNYCPGCGIKLIREKR